MSHQTWTVGCTVEVKVHTCMYMDSGLHCGGQGTHMHVHGQWAALWRSRYTHACTWTVGCTVEVKGCVGGEVTPS